MTNDNPSLTTALVLLLCCFLTPSFSKGEDTCIISPTQCQCAPNTPSRTCLRSHGNGTCVLGACNPGFRCDCFGFELCNLTKCGKYVPTGKDQPSTSVPFRCDLVPESSECVTVMETMDTVTAGRHAEGSTVASNDEVTSYELQMTAMLEATQTQKQVVNQMLHDIDRVADDVPIADLRSINEDATKVNEAVAEMSSLVNEVVGLGRKVGAIVLKARELKRAAVNKGIEVAGKRTSHEEEEEKARKENTTCTTCAENVKQIEALIRERKAAARECGRKAQDAREVARTAQDKVKEAELVKDRSTVAFRSCNGRVKGSLGTVSGRVLATSG